ncbi:MAG: 50S ribosomal protein L1 [Candidatus Sumerlaeia bacterium]|nr:50S ribosomal protein L1 [Candidatus Sumerlaeia bacterium]
MRRGKRYIAAKAKLEEGVKYSLEEGIKKLREVNIMRGDPSVDLHIRLNVDPRNSEHQVRGTVVLPYGQGKPVRVLVLARGDKAKEAKEAGADYVGDTDLIEKIQGGWLEFDVMVATPDMMREVAKVGKILGPRGLMPSPKAGTVTMDIAGTVKELKKGRIEFRFDRTGIIHTTIGKLSFKDNELEENARALLEAVIKARPPAVKGQFIKSITLASTMSPGIRLDYKGA